MFKIQPNGVLGSSTRAAEFLKNYFKLSKYNILQDNQSLPDYFDPFGRDEA